MAGTTKTTGTGKVQKQSELMLQLKELLNTTLDVFREKGIKFFKIPLALGLCGGLFIYTTFYKPVSPRITSIKKSIEALQVQNSVSKDYEIYRSRIVQYEDKFPKLSDKSNWLSETIRQAFKTEGGEEGGITPDNIGSQSTNESLGDIVIADINVRAHLPFSAMANIIAKLEYNRLMVKVTRLSVTKDNDVRRQVAMDLTVSTVYPRSRMNAVSRVDTSTAPARGFAPTKEKDPMLSPEDLRIIAEERKRIEEALRAKQEEQMRRQTPKAQPVEDYSAIEKSIEIQGTVDKQVIINGNVYSQGQKINKDLKVEKVTSGAVTFRYKNHVFTKRL